MRERAVALESIIREWVTFIWTRGDSCRTWRRDSGAWGRASTSADRGAKAAAGRLGMIVDRFFDGLVCVSTLRLRGAGGLATRPETHGTNHKDCERGKGEREREKAVARESIIREWVTFIWTRGDSCRTWGRDSEAWAWGRASTSADRGATWRRGETQPVGSIIREWVHDRRSLL